MKEMANMELRAVVPAIFAMFFVPTADQVVRFLIPILSGLAWYFLKKLIIYIENRKKRNNNQNE